MKTTLNEVFLGRVFLIFVLVFAKLSLVFSKIVVGLNTFRGSCRSQRYPRTMIIQRLFGITMFVVAIVLLLYFSDNKIYVYQKHVENYVLMDKYELWRSKFMAMVRMNYIRSSKAFQIMLKNNINSRRILQIIEEESKDMTSFEDHQCVTIKPDCPLQPPHLKGRMLVKQWILQERKKKLREQQNYTYTRHSGVWSPPQCESRHSVAIIIPYRDRRHQLQMLLQHLPPILKRQQINYNIFVIEQVGNKTFNKGILMNAGFMTALSMPAHGVTYHCFIFHDVDLLSEDDRNMYTCPEFPRHMSNAVDELDYELPYEELVGGVFAIRTDHFIEVNGYSNLYWGWGGEDDDMGLRVGKALKWMKRPPVELGRFSTVPHIKETPFQTNDMRHQLVMTAHRRYQVDGLNSVKFNLKEVVQKDQFTHVYVDVGSPPMDYRPLMDFGRSQLKRILTQQLLRKVRERKRNRSGIPSDFQKSGLPGEVPNIDGLELSNQPIKVFSHAQPGETLEEIGLKTNLWDLF